MRMEVGREVSATPPTAEGSVASDAAQKAAARLQEVSQERQRWIAKRQQALARQEKLLKLLKLQEARKPNGEQVDANATTNEGRTAETKAKEIEEKAAKAAAAALAQKKELKELQARAEAAKEKQLAAATVLTRNLKQLNQTKAAALANTVQRSPANKRKREEEEPTEQPCKKADVKVGADAEPRVALPEMYSFAAAPDMDVGTAELAAAACFRIAVRHLAETGTTISRGRLGQEFKNYTGKKLEEAVDSSLLLRSLPSVHTDDTRQIVFLSISKAGSSACWQPGRQFLRKPTFISSNADRIQAFIEVEKQVVEDVCASLRRPGKLSSTLINRCRQKQFLASLVADGVATPNSSTLSYVLCACIGVISKNSMTINTCKHISYRSHGQIAGVLCKMEMWLRKQAKTSEPRNNVSTSLDAVGAYDGSPTPFLSKYAKPFSVENDSVVKQLRQVGGATKTIDPMKVFCRYELNGVCNDKNCSNYHQKDYETVDSEMNKSSGCSNDEDAREPGMDIVDQLLLSFSEFRGRIMTKWPVVCSTTQNSLSASQKSKGANCVTEPTHLSGASGLVPAVVSGAQYQNDSEDSIDFIALDTVSEGLPEISDTRYFNGIRSRKVYGNMLQAKVEEDPNDSDAWLLLAIYHLELDTELSDEAANFSDGDRIKHQLVNLCKELDMKHRSGGSSQLNLEEENLKRCLRTLSRALEVEANAYCEALWLLYLHLCRQVTEKQTEVDMVEQAVQFLPSSHALWLRYVSTYDFDSVNLAEGIYWRLLEHLARTTPAEKSSALPSTGKALSILLTAICFHLCIKLWRAGATDRVLKLMAALLQFGDTSPEFGWCSKVRGRLRSNEIIALCLVFAHVQLFNKLPTLIEHWVTVSSYENVPIKRMAYSFESIKHSGFQVDKEAFTGALAGYDFAFRTFERECSGERHVGGVILSNWMLLIAFQEDTSRRDECLDTFFQKYLTFIQQCPEVSLTAAKVMTLRPSLDKHAHDLLFKMMDHSSDILFPEALHHYLFASRHFPELVDSLDKSFPDVMERLARLLDFDIEKVEKTIQDIKDDTSSISKSRALKTLLDALLAAWMDQLAFTKPIDQPKAHPDIYLALNISYLMGVLLEPSVAIDGIQLILSSSRFGTLSLEARQLVWIQRFVFQLDLFQQEHVDSLSWREHQMRLTQLFRKYISEMSVEAEMLRQVSKRISCDIDKKAIEDAVCDCLYPERTALITYDANLELFRLCSSAVADPEKPAFYALFTDVLALSSEFSLAFSESATHEWELLAARASLRRCLIGAKTQHPEVLQALVAVELKLRNMKSVSSLLESEIKADPLLLETWRLAVGLEILFGESLAERSKTISLEMEKRQLVFACNTFGDNTVTEEKVLSRDEDSESAVLTLRGLGLECIPNCVLLKTNLVSLNVSGNKLLGLPKSLGRLKRLQHVNASENALVEFPACINSLAQLKKLELAHNNFCTVSMPPLQHLNHVDIRWNAVPHLPSTALATLKSLKVLQTEANPISADEVSIILQELSKENNESARNLAGDAAGSQKEIDDSVRNLAGDATEREKEIPKKQHTNASLSTTEITESQDLQSAVGLKDADSNQMMAEEDDGEDDVEIVEMTKKQDVSTNSDANHIINQPSVEVNKLSVEDVDEPMNEEDDQRVSEKPHSGTARSSVKLPARTEQYVINVESPEAKGDAETSGNHITTDSTNITELMMRSTTKPIDRVVSIGSSSSIETFRQHHVEAAAAATARRQSSDEPASIVQEKLTAYMEQNHIENRAEVRTRNPALWREFLAVWLPESTQWSVCRLCFAPNRGQHQRFNSAVICLRCWEELLSVAKDRDANEDN